MATVTAPLIPITVGEPDVHGALAVFPLVRSDEPALEYVALPEALARGLQVTELPGGASVNDLLVHNPLDVPVLLLEGEEVVGAQQNRTFDVSVLVAAGTTLKVPVTCVEEQRWDGSRHAEGFAAGGRSAFPELRRRKAEAMTRMAAREASAPLRADQGEVWAEVAMKHQRLRVDAPTSAMADAYEDRRTAIDACVEAVRRRDGQVGALATIDGRCVVVDAVGRADVWAALHAPIVRGYALDALESTNDAPARVDADAAASWVDLVLRSAWQERPAVGLGRQLALSAATVTGTGLRCDGELVALSAFPASGLCDRAPQGRVRRPSRRRHG
jgi:hypothetical protein